MKVAVAGAGAFGTALAIALAVEGRDVSLVARDQTAADHIKKTKENPKLAGCPLPNNLMLDVGQASLDGADAILLAVPTQQLRPFLNDHANVCDGKYLVACCKGIDLKTLKGPSSIIQESVPKAKAAVLTGPSFAFDIARGLPTALTLATKEEKDGQSLQTLLSTKSLRVYRSEDVLGAELGGALKNVIAIGAGVAIGSGLGDSARSALMTRGFGEMRQLAEVLGAAPETLYGLSGFGDLALTCTSSLSRNFCHGLALGKQQDPDTTKTVEGVTTAQAVVTLAQKHGLDLPVCSVVAAICTGALTPNQALASLLARPLKEE